MWSRHEALHQSGSFSRRICEEFRLQHGGCGVFHGLWTSYPRANPLRARYINHRNDEIAYRVSVCSLVFEYRRVFL